MCQKRESEYFGFPQIYFLVSCVRHVHTTVPQNEKYSFTIQTKHVATMQYVCYFGATG